MALGIAFEGCAGRSAFSAGVAIRLRELGAMPGLVAGASSGAIVAAFAAAARTAELEEAWMGAAGRRVFRPDFMLRPAWPFRMSDLVGDAMSAAFGDMRLDELPLPLAIPVTFLGLRGRSSRLLTRADPVSVSQAVLASCFIPGPYSKVVRIGGRIAFDGAWQQRIPVSAVRALGARRIIAVSGHPLDTVAEGFPFVRRSPLPRDCRAVRPAAPLELGGYDTDPDRIRAAIGAGRLAADRFVEAEGRWLDQGP